MSTLAAVSADPRIALIDSWQRDFPLVPRPYAGLARASDLSERELIAMLEDCVEEGILTRIGAVVKPNTVGASTLAAMAVPAADMERVTATVNAEPGVNHNYEREHALNLWFVVTAPDAAALAATLARIAERTGLRVIDLPLERAYHIDLGFPLDGRGDSRRGAGSTAPGRAPDAADRALIAAIEDGLPIAPRPYAEVACRLGWREQEVIDRLADLLAAGLISRMGCIVRHRTLGFTANAMVAWNVPDDRVDSAGLIVGCNEIVTLCYRRTRRPPDWPYNLFAMVHGRERARVQAAIEDVTLAAGLGDAPRAVLFSKRCFRQRGARFSAPPVADRPSGAAHVRPA